MRQVILNIHGIGIPGRPLEKGEQPYWIRSEQFSEILDLCKSLSDRVNVNFTFDDGNASDLAIGADLLAGHGIKAAFFVLADRIGTPGSLSETDIAALLSMGHEIGSHGAAHLDWTMLDDAGLGRELDEARRHIENVAGRRILAAGIPFGQYNARVLRELRLRRYDRVYSSDGGPWRTGQFPIPRSSVRGAMSLPEIEAILLGQESFTSSLRRIVSRAKKRLL